MSCKLGSTTQERDVAYGIVRARVASIGASNGRDTRRERKEGVTVKIYVGAGKRAVVLTGVDRRGAGEREQRQEGDNEGNGVNHVERGEEKRTWERELLNSTGGLVRRR